MLINFFILKESVKNNMQIKIDTNFARTQIQSTSK